jgi:hypothetical protein
VEDRRFDALVRSLSAAPSRRGLLAAALAAFGLAGEEGDAKPTGAGKGTGKGKGGRGGKEHGRNRGNGNGNGRNRKGKRCNPKPDAEVCDGKCGDQENNCGQRVRCPDCTCATGCEDCTVCNPRTGACDPDLAAIGNPCGDAASCAQGTATPRGTCLADGTCDPGKPRDCAPYTCAGDACAETCLDDDDCVGTSYCDGGGACVDDLPVGARCADDKQCEGGHCAQGVCCATACDKPCESCNLPGSVGFCVVEADGTACHGAKGICAGGLCEPCGGGGQRCCPGDACADGGCCEDRFCVAAGDPCGDPETCLSVTYTPRGTCTAGTCRPGTSVSCSPYRCGRDRCADSCRDDGDCVGEAFCNAAGLCAGDLADGAPCDRREQCASGICARGVCCDRDCPGPCEACDLAGNRGSCDIIINGGACRGEDGVCFGGTCVACADDADCGPCERCDDGNTCVADASRNGTACSGGAGVCLGGVCEPCGGSGQICCFDGPNQPPTCEAGFQCEPSGTVPVCAPCGGDGEPCCLLGDDGDVLYCGEGFGCRVADNTAVCAPCGEPGQPCCLDIDFDAPPTGLPFSCGEWAYCPPSDESLVCAACGGAGQPCCEDVWNPAGPQPAPCRDNLVCSGAGGTCTPCGGSGQPCCPDLQNQTVTCGAGLGCTLDAGVPVCAICGGDGEACCVEVVDGKLLPSCESGLGCNGQTCEPCGGRRERCCIDFASFTPFCDPGLTCDETFCVE